MKVSNTITKETLSNIRNALDQQKDLNESWSNYANFVYNKTLSSADIAVLKNNDRDTFDFNVVRPFIWKSLKNVSDSSVTGVFKATKDNNTEQQSALPIDEIVDIVSQKYETIKEESNYNNVIYGCSQDAYVGGKGVIKIKTEYENNYNFSQTFKIDRVLNPTLIYFDNKARLPTKADSCYVFEIISISEDEFKRDYPHIKIESINKDFYGGVQPTVQTQTGSTDKMINIIEYYYKQSSDVVLYELTNGKITQDKPSSNKQIAISRKIKSDTVMMQRIVGDIELTPPRKTNFKSLPFVMVMGERYYDKDDKEHINPFAKQAFDAQRVKNMSMNFLLYEMYNNRAGTSMLPNECATDATEEALRNPSIKNVIRYNAIHTTEDNQTVVLEPKQIPSTPLPDQYLEVFSALDSTIESTLGANMPSMDTSNMSGKALYNLSQFTSASNEQFMQHLECAAVQVARVILEAMPKVLEKEIFTIVSKETGETEKEFDFMFETDLLNVAISRGVDNKLQQEATVETLMDFAEKSPMFANFMNTPEAISLVINNLDLNHKDKLVAAWDDFLKQQQEEAGEPNPEQQQEEINHTLAQAKLMTAQAAQESVNLRAHELGLKQRNSENDQLIEQHKIKSANHRNNENNQVKIIQSKDNLKKHLIDHAEKQFNSAT